MATMGNASAGRVFPGEGDFERGLAFVFDRARRREVEALVMRGKRREGP
jgi:hypothetical protein